MDEARSVDEWQRACLIAAYAGNSHPHLKRPYQPMNIMPLKMKNRGTQITKENFSSLKALCQQKSTSSNSHSD